jgi:hypothetical protein
MVGTPTLHVLKSSILPLDSRHANGRVASVISVGEARRKECRAPSLGFCRKRSDTLY